jgi:hypothetical protein
MKKINLNISKEKVVKTLKKVGILTLVSLASGAAGYVIGKNQKSESDEATEEYYEESVLTEDEAVTTEE